MNELPASMTAVEVAEPGGPDALRPATRPLPTLKPGELLVKVAAAGVNRPDVLQRKGGYPPPPGASDIPGLEIAGTVVALGSGATRWQIGDKVCALVTGGGYAEYCAAPSGQCLPWPDGFDAVRAAALPETFFTVWSNLVGRAKLKAGETLLVHGGSSGIGTTAIQIAKMLGVTVLVTAGSDEKCAACLKLGAARAINYKTEDYVEAAKEATGGKGVNVILDMVGGDYIARDIAALASEGRLVFIAFQKGRKVEIDFQPIMVKRLTITGSTLRPRDVAFKSAVARELEESVWPWLSAGKIAPQIQATFALKDAASAHRLIDSGEHIGKIVLTV
ncbi:MAG TPA: NAD(P)H-quinone oxidoreductase [Alphaproteobacteria bacterium]|nr:NAD(P)H-quinone oxidoreductase [Alphaproteobacteria bacterium]